MAKENKTAYLILGLLTERPMSGYDINEEIKRKVGFFWNISYGQIYPTLKRLEKKGFISKKNILQENKPYRKEYTLKKKGLEYLQEWLKKPIDEEKHRFEILLKLFFGDVVPVEHSIEHIKQEKRSYKLKLQILKSYEAELRKILNEAENHKYFLATVLFGINFYQAQLKWCDEVIDLLTQN